MMSVDMYLTDGNLGASLRANRRIAPSGNGDLNLHHAFQRWVRCGGRRLVAVVDSTHAFQRWVRCGDPPSHTRVPEMGTTWGLEHPDRSLSPHHPRTGMRAERQHLFHHEMLVNFTFRESDTTTVTLCATDLADSDMPVMITGGH